MNTNLVEFRTQYAMRAAQYANRVADSVRLNAPAMPRAVGTIGAGGLSTVNLVGDTHSGHRQQLYQYFKDWTYIAINAIATRVSSQRWLMGEVDNAAANTTRPTVRRQWRATQSMLDAMPESVFDMSGVFRKELLEERLIVHTQGPILDMLKWPNPIQNKQDFVMMTIYNLLLSGEGYWLGGLVQDQDGNDRIELWALPSSWWTPVHDGGLYTSFQLTWPGLLEHIEIPAENVCRLYFPDPTAIKSAYSPTAAAIAAIRVDSSIQHSQDEMFARGITPNVIVSIGRVRGPDGKLTDRRPTLSGAQRRMMIRAIRQMWREQVNIGDPAIVDGMIESIHKLQNTPQEMDWPASEKIIKARILQAFKVNPIVVGEVTPSNKAQAVVAENSFCVPRGTYIDTPNGARRIEEIQVGDEVYSHTGNVRQVLRTFRRPYRGEIMEIQAPGRPSLQLTPNHEMLVSRQGRMCWVPAGELQMTDMLSFPTPAVNVQSNRAIRVADVILHRIRSIGAMPYDGEVFNCEVEEEHSYVTCAGGAVHNCQMACNPLVDDISLAMTSWIGPWIETPKRLLLWLEKCVPVDEELELAKWTAARENDDVTSDEFRAHILRLPPLENQEDTAKALNQAGGLQQIIDLLRAVGVGEVQPDQAVATLVVTMRMSEEDARNMVGTGPSAAQLAANGDGANGDTAA